MFQVMHQRVEQRPAPRGVSKLATAMATLFRSKCTVVAARFRHGFMFYLCSNFQHLLCAAEALSALTLAQLSVDSSNSFKQWHEHLL